MYVVSPYIGIFPESITTSVIGLSLVGYGMAYISIPILPAMTTIIKNKNPKLKLEIVNDIASALY